MALVRCYVNAVLGTGLAVDSEGCVGSDRGSLCRLLTVLDWLRRKGPGYQNEISRILREKMQAEMAT